MRLHFYKYQATGNDFVLVDNREGTIQLSLEQIKKICDRRFGIGADGLMLLEKQPGFDFNLTYFNSDGSQSLCGNGTRAAVRLASSLGMINGKADFNAHDGRHHGELFSDGTVKIKMNDVNKVIQSGEDWIIHTGSPHLIRFAKDVKEYPVFEEGKKIRYSETFRPDGINVNFVELKSDNTIFVRTYERGVENETLSCGTGVTAAALAVHFKGYRSPLTIETQGGKLSVEFKSIPDKAGQAGAFQDIYLIGPAKMVFEGDLEL